MRSNGLRHVLMDIDGTILNSEAIVNEALNVSMLSHGLKDIPPDIVRKYFGFPGLVFLKIVKTPNAEDVFNGWCRELRARREHQTL